MSKKTTGKYKYLENYWSFNLDPAYASPITLQFNYHEYSPYDSTTNQFVFKAADAERLPVWGSRHFLNTATRDSYYSSHAKKLIKGIIVSTGDLNAEEAEERTYWLYTNGAWVEVPLIKEITTCATPDEYVDAFNNPRWRYSIFAELRKEEAEELKRREEALKENDYEKEEYEYKDYDLIDTFQYSFIIGSPYIEDYNSEYSKDLYDEQIDKYHLNAIANIPNTFDHIEINIEYQLEESTFLEDGPELDTWCSCEEGGYPYDISWFCNYEFIDDVSGVSREALESTGLEVIESSQSDIKFVNYVGNFKQTFFGKALQSPRPAIHPDSLVLYEKDEDGNVILDDDDQPVVKKQKPIPYKYLLPPMKFTFTAINNIRCPIKITNLQTSIVFVNYDSSAQIESSGFPYRYAEAERKHLDISYERVLFFDGNSKIDTTESNIEEDSDVSTSGTGEKILRVILTPMSNLCLQTIANAENKPFVKGVVLHGKFAEVKQVEHEKAWTRYIDSDGTIRSHGDSLQLRRKGNYAYVAEYHIEDFNLTFQQYIMEISVKSLPYDLAIPVVYNKIPEPIYAMVNHINGLSEWFPIQNGTTLTFVDEGSSKINKDPNTTSNAILSFGSKPRDRNTISFLTDVDKEHRIDVKLNYQRYKNAPVAYQPMFDDDEVIYDTTPINEDSDN